MKKVATLKNSRGELYDLYAVEEGTELADGTIAERDFVNLVPAGAPAPVGGYYNPLTLFKLKGF